MVDRKFNEFDPLSYLIQCGTDHYPEPSSVNEFFNNQLIGDNPELVSLQSSCAHFQLIDAENQLQTKDR